MVAQLALKWETPIKTIITNADKLRIMHLTDVEFKTRTWIANEYGITRSTVSGIVFRMRCSNGHQPTTRAKPNKPRKARPTLKISPQLHRLLVIRKALTDQVVTVKPRVRLNLITDKGHVTFEQLAAHHCRWPMMGQPGQDDFRYCGGKRVDDKLPYCNWHCQMAYVPLKPRRR